MRRKTIVVKAVVLAALACRIASGQTTDVSDVDLFAQQPIIDEARLSPDGTRIAYLSSLRGRYHVIVERFKPSFERNILLPADDLDFRWVEWANNERLVISTSFSAKRDVASDDARRQILVETVETRLFSAGSGLEELVQLITPERAQGATGTKFEQELLPPQIQDQVIDWMPNDPHHILVALDANFDGSDEVRRVDIRDGSYVELVDRAPARWNWVSDASGEVRIGWKIEDDELAVVKFDPDTSHSDSDDRWVDISASSWVRAQYLPLAFSKDPDVLLVRGENDNGLYVIRTARLSTGEFIDTIFQHERIDAGWISFDDSSRMAIGINYTEHLPAIEYFDSQMKILKKSVDAALPGKTNVIASTSKDWRQVLVLSYSDTDAGSYYIWDRDSKSLDHYADRYPALSDGQLLPVEDASYEARDGLRIPAYLTFPKEVGRQRLPTVVLPHGGPHSRDDKSYGFISQFLAARGYVVLQPNFRGSSGYGASFADAGRKEWGGKMQDDVSDGAQWLIEQGIADPDRICVVGWSYGGYAAAMGAIKTPDLFNCAVSINGVFDLPQQLAEDRKYVGGREWSEHVGLEGESSKAVSPYHLAEAIRVPMLIIQSRDDARVHLEQGKNMAARLRKLGKDVEYVEIDIGGHSIENVDGRKTILESLGTFLARHLD